MNGIDMKTLGGMLMGLDERVRERTEEKGYAFRPEHAIIIVAGTITDEDGSEGVGCFHRSIGDRWALRSVLSDTANDLRVP